MKFFDFLYVGRRTEDNWDYYAKTVDTYILGFLTPYEENKAGVKRRLTVDEWAQHTHMIHELDINGDLIRPRRDQSYKMHDVLDPIKFRNEPISGFRLANMVRRSTSNNVVWRIEEPRGFQLDISSPNLQEIIALHGLEKGGIIPAKCVWGRDGAQNYLVCEGSELMADYEE